MKTRSAFLAACVVFICAVASSNWQPTNTFSASFPNTFAWDGEYVYAGTYWGVFVSSDNGAHWYRANAGLGVNPNIMALLVVHLASRTYVFAGCSDGIFVTTNRGTQWAATNTGLPNGSSVSALIQFNLDIFAATNFGVYRSTNFGAQWTIANNGLPADGVQDFATSGATLYAATGWGGLHRTTNFGASWTRITEIVGYAAKIKSRGSSLYVITDQRSYRSTDDGRTWLSNGSVFGTTTFVVQETGPELAHVLYAAGNTGISRSLDSGRTWSQLNNGLPQFPAGYSLIAIGSSTNYSLLLGIGSVLLYPTENGIFRSTNLGVDWRVSNAGMSELGVSALTAYDRHFLAGTTFYDLMRSTDRGEAWRLTLPYFYGYTHTNAFLFKGTYLFCGNERGLFASGDFGATWQGLSFTSEVRALALAANRVVLASGNNVFFSTNEGASWTVSASGLPGRPIVSILVDSSASPTKIFVGTEGAGIYASTDFGAFWASSSVGIPPGSSVRAMTSVARNGNPTLIAGLNSGVYASTDRGASWSLQSSAVTNVRAFASNSQYLFSGSGSAGVFLSTNGGTNWSAVSTGLADQVILSLLIYNSKLYAGTGGTGLWERLLSEFEPTGVQEPKTQPTEFLLSQNFPNPFNPSTTITISLPTQSDFALTIYDLLGREVKSYAFERVPAGVHSVVWDGRDKLGKHVASGVYFYRLKANNFVATRKLLLQK